LPLVKKLSTIGNQNIEKKKFDILIEVLEQIWDNYNEAEVILKELIICKSENEDI